MSIGRYHYVCAALQKAYRVTTVPAQEVYGATFDRQGLIFDAYTAYKLKPILGVKLHPSEEGTIDPEDLTIYVDSFEQNWKSMEGGIMYWVEQRREFWNMVLNYNSSSATMGRKEWDDLFSALKTNNYDKGLVPCMVSALFD